MICCSLFIAIPNNKLQYLLFKVILIESNKLSHPSQPLLDEFFKNGL